MGCTVDQERYSSPMPWIGLYITVASAACSIAMLVDHVQGTQRRKVWFPCKLFSLNATSLTLLAIATKLPVDLSTPMPGAAEQFAKLTGTSLICIAMGHFMPSIGAMEDSQVILNVVPLVILVITVIVNICIQMGTGVIHTFIPEHIITLCFMLVMLLITCSSALAIPTIKGLLKHQLEFNCQEVKHERQQNEPAMSTVESLKKDIKKYLIMALTSNPQYVLSRSYLGTVAGGLCYYQAAVLIEALVRMLKRVLVPVCTNQSSSDYKWSIPFIVFSQAFAVIMGAVAPILRVNKVNFSTGNIGSQGHQSPEAVEREVLRVGKGNFSTGIIGSQGHQNPEAVEREVLRVGKGNFSTGIIGSQGHQSPEAVEREVLRVGKGNFCTGNIGSQGHQSPEAVEREVQATMNLQKKSLVKRYWIQKIVEWRDRPLLVFDIRSRCCRRRIHGFKYWIFEIMRWAHIGVVVFCTFMDPRGVEYYPIWLIKMLPLLRLLFTVVEFLGKLIKMLYEKIQVMIERMILQAIEKMEPMFASRARMMESHSRTDEARESAAEKAELKHFVLHLENEGKFVDQIMHHCDFAIDRWIQEESHRTIANLINLLAQASDGSPRFTGRAQSNTTNQAQECSDCWALPLVTLTSIALAIPCTQGDQIKQLLQDGVNEAIKYVRHVDKSLDARGDLTKVRQAADVVWQGVDLYNQWLDLDLSAFVTEEKDPKNVIEQLANKGSGYEAEVESLMKGRVDMKSGLRWPPRALALYSMANICKSILNTHSNFSIDDADGLFKQLHVMISDMLGACLTDLPRALYIQCHKSSMESKDDEVMDTAHLLREAENIFKTISTKGLVINQHKYVEYWRPFMPNWSVLPCISPVSASNMAV